MITDAINNFFNRFPDSVNQDVLFKIGKTGLTVTNFQLQYIRYTKGNWNSASPSTAVTLTELTNITDPHVDNAAKFIGTGTDPLATDLRVCVPDAAFAANVDVVDLSIRSDADDLAFSVVINIIHTPSLRNVLKERAGITSAIINKAGTPGQEKFIVLYTDFVGSAQQLGAEILNAMVAAAPATGSLTEERVFVPILGSYYSDGAGAFTQIQGIMAQLGVTSTIDLNGASWIGAATEATSSGYTLILPFYDNFNAPDSNEPIAIVYEAGAWGNNFRGPDGYPFGDPGVVFGGPNFRDFFNNNTAASTKVQDDVGAGTGDFTSGEAASVLTVLGITDSSGTITDLPSAGVGRRIALKTDNLPHTIQKNVGFNNFEFLMLDSTTGQPAVGLTIVSERSVDGTAFAAMTNSAAQVSDGVYKQNISADDTNGVSVMWKFTASGAKTRFVYFVTET